MYSLSTRNRIILLVVLAALPTLALTIYGSWDERVRVIQGARENLQRLVKLAAQQQEQVIEGVNHTLAAISLIPPEVLNAPVSCNEYLARLFEKGARLYHSMGIYSADGVLVCNAVPWQGKITSPDRLYVQLPLATGKFTIGEYQIGRVTKLQGINFGYPLTDSSGKISGVAFIALDLNSLKRMAATIPLPEQGVIAVVDRSGTLLARYPDAAERIGHKLSVPHILETILAGRSGVFEAKGSDGIERLVAYETVADNPDGVIPIRILVSIPVDAIYKDANRAILRNMIGILAATLLLLLLGARYGAEFFLLRSIEKLLTTAKRVRCGELGARTGMRFNNDELHQLGQEFDNMAATLEADRTLLHESDEKFRALSDQSCVGIVTIVDGKITYANERMAQLSGYSVEEILRMHPVDAAVESERARVADYMQKFLAGETTEAKFAYHGLRKDGTVLDIEAYNSVMHIGGKRGLIVVNLDVSDRVHAEQELQVLHTQMREQAIHDGLTGLFNRRYLDETLTRELIRAQRVSYPVSVIMGDIDYFKKINDKYGHQAGDDVLKEFARLLKRYCRGSDIPCRYGGEEFLLLMPDSPLDGAVRRAEELRLAMADMRLEYDGSPLGKITISLGVASFPEHGADAKSLLHAADEALYEAKGTGRDRVVVYRRFD